jgi:hypothetical protein
LLISAGLAEHRLAEGAEEEALIGQLSRFALRGMSD